MAWKTCLILYIGTEAPLSDVVSRVEKLGFKSQLGPVDFAFDWSKQPTKAQVFDLGDKLTTSLKGTGCIFNIDTHE